MTRDEYMFRTVARFRHGEKCGIRVTYVKYNDMATAMDPTGFMFTVYAQIGEPGLRSRRLEVIDERGGSEVGVWFKNGFIFDYVRKEKFSFDPADMAAMQVWIDSTMLGL